jgi:hypothetical protein
VELVNAEGEYKWTADHEFVERYFQLVELSAERSLYGRNRPKLGPLNSNRITERVGCTEPRDGVSVPERKPRARGR